MKDPNVSKSDSVEAEHEDFSRSSKPLSVPEFVTMLALMVSLLALSIDSMLPALGEISDELKPADPNDIQLIVTMMLFGFAAGQIVAGPLSDSFGRKPIIYGGYVLFIIGCILSISADSFVVMLVGRFLQGLGAASPRIVSVALVRDGYEGRAMARIMSIIMAIFILVPSIAPAIGQGVMLVSNWRAIFGLLLAIAIVAFVWFAIRQPETLHPALRRKFSLGAILGGIREAVGYRALAGYTLATGIIFGAFVGYLSSSQQVFQNAYGAGQWFVVYFGCASLSIGVASAFNAKVVVRLGMKYMTWRALFGLTAASVLFIPLVLASNGLPPLWVFMIWLIVVFFFIGIVFGNFNALAMEPVGHMAGLGAAIVGSVGTFISLPIGWAIGGAFNGTVTPLVAGFAVSGGLCLAVMWWTEGGMERQ